MAGLAVALFGSTLITTIALGSLRVFREQPRQSLKRLSDVLEAVGQDHLEATESWVAEPEYVMKQWESAGMESSLSPKQVDEARRALVFEQRLAEIRRELESTRATLQGQTPYGVRAVAIALAVLAFGCAMALAPNQNEGEVSWAIVGAAATIAAYALGERRGESEARFSEAVEDATRLLEPLSKLSGKE